MGEEGRCHGGFRPPPIDLDPRSKSPRVNFKKYTYLPDVLPHVQEQVPPNFWLRWKPKAQGQQHQASFIVPQRVQDVFDRMFTLLFMYLRDSS